MEKHSLNIAVAGTGYVGLSLATLLAQHHKVTAVDIVPEKVDKINRVVRMLTYAVRHETVETMLTTGRIHELIQAHWRIYEVLSSKTEEGLEEIIHNTYFLDVGRE